MEPNQNPPSERDWTPEEMEEFFASQDAVTGMFNEGIASNAGTYWRDTLPISPSWLRMITDEMGTKFPAGYGIVVTSIVPPEQGWPIVAHCDLCRKTVIVLSPWAVKPEKVDYWKMEGTCLDEDLHIKHNMYPQKWYPWPTKPLPGGYVDATGPHRGVPPTEEDFQQVALVTMNRTMFAQGPIKFSVHDPLLPLNFPSMIEIVQEMPIEEAKKRWPNEPIPGEKKK